MELENFNINNAKKQIETEAKKLASKADNFKELENFDMDKPGIIQTLAFVFLGFIQDLFLKQNIIEQRNKELINLSNATIIPSVESKGYVNFTGNIGGVIPANSILIDPITENEYKTLEEGTINLDTYIGTIIEINEAYTKIKTDNDCDLSSGLEIEIIQSFHEDVNNFYFVTILDRNSFLIDKSFPESYKGSSVLISLKRALIPVKSSNSGSNQNETDGVALNLSTSLLNVNDKAYVNILGLVGGRDIEIQRNNEKQQEGSVFGKRDIEKELKKIEGVTRIFIISPSDFLNSYNPEKINHQGKIAFIEKKNHLLETGARILVENSPFTSFNGNFDILKIDENNFLYHMIREPEEDPDPSIIFIQGQEVPNGSVKIFFVKDESNDILPTIAEITEAQNLLYKISPINTSKNNIIIKNPFLKRVDVKINYNFPKTDNMKKAINKSLEDFFVSNKIYLGSTLYINDLISIVNNTRDEEGNSPQELSILEPLKNINSQKEELLVLGEITYV